MQTFDIRDFFAKIWGEGSSDRCLVRMSQSGGMRHIWGNDVDFYEQALGEVNYFFAPFVFDARTRRQKHAYATRAFWADIDVKPGAPEGTYGTLADAAAAVRNFIDSAAFPAPTYIVQSGAGLHLYWCVNEDIPESTWHRKALKLKGLFSSAGLLVDKSRTADSASLMRVPGTTNKKEGRQPLRVEILKQYSIIDADVFFKRLDDACKTHRVEVVEAKKESRLDVLKNSMLATQEYDREKYSSDEMASRCAQLGRVRACGGVVSEPLWYATIQVLRFTREADSAPHEWSKGDARYDPEKVDAKIAQLDEKGIGPTTCAQLQSVGSPELCKDCAFKKSIKSPIQLAVRVAKVEPSEAGEESIVVRGSEVPVGFVPKGFYLTETGSLAFKHPETGVMVDFYPYPLFVNKRVLNNTGMFHISVDTWLPHDGYLNITMPMSVCKDQMTLTEELAARGIVCTDGEDKILRMYIVESIRQLTSRFTAVKGYSSYGWDNGEFFIHDAAYGEDGEKEAIFTGENELCTTKGSAQPWGEVFDHYEKASTAYRMAFYAGFSAPLMELTGLSGVTYSMVSGESGVGKTTVQSVVCAMYGNPEALRAQRTDTYNSLMKRLGVYNSLPLCVDEMTNIDSEHLSEFVYQVSQGRERSRLTQAATMQGSGRWKTIVLSSSNELLASKIRSIRGDGEAELARLIEVYAPAYTTKDALNRVNRIVSENYGVLGADWVRNVAKHRSRVQAVVNHYTELVERKSKWGSQGRFHIAFLATCAASVALTNKWFGRNVDVDKFISAAIDEIEKNKTQGARVAVDEKALSAYVHNEETAEAVRREIESRNTAGNDSLNAWLDGLVRHVVGCSVIRKSGKRVITPQEVKAAIDENTGMLYIPAAIAERIVREAKVGSTHLAKFRKVPYRLYEGTELASSLAVSCYEIDISHIQFGVRAAPTAHGGNTSGIAA